MSIDDIVNEFLTEQHERLKDSTFQQYAGIINLFQIYLNEYGYSNLIQSEDVGRWEDAFDEDEDAFCRLFGAQELVDGLGEFLNYFMIRKVIASQQELQSASTVTKKLVSWLKTHKLITDEIAAEALEEAKAAKKLPAMERLGEIFYELGLQLTPAQAREFAKLPLREIVEDHLAISKVSPHRLYFEGVDGHLVVPAEASTLAQVGWSAYLVLAEIGGQWRIIQSGSVYPS